jgi:hypothetical protein
MKAYEASFDVHAEQRALQDLTIGQLQQRYLELVGEVSQSRNRPYLVKRILWFEQASRHGGLSDDAKALAATLARDVDVRTTIPPHALAAPERPRPPGGDPRLPAPGRAIVRRYKGSFPKRPLHGPSARRTAREHAFHGERKPRGSHLTARTAAANLHLAVDDDRLRRKSSAWRSYPHADPARGRPRGAARVQRPQAAAPAGAVLPLR